MSKLHIQMYPSLTEEMIKRLNQRKIFSVLDILQQDAEKLVSITKLTYKDVIQLRHNLASNCSAFPCNGMDVLNDLTANSARISTGIHSLDLILDGGLYTGNLYEICGLSGSGKTELCLTISANVARVLKQNVHYLDTKCDFSGKRIQAVLKTSGCQCEEIDRIMERIHVTRIEDVHQLLAFLHDMKNNHYIDQDSKSATRIVIVDSLPVLYFPHLGEASRDNLGLLNHMAITMKYLAVEYHLTFLLVNLVTRRYDDEIVPNDSEDQSDDRYNNVEIIKPALGKYWSHVPSIRISIDNENCNAKRQVKITKSINSGCDICTLTLGENGLT